VTKILALATVLAAGVGYMVWTSTQGSAEYYQTVAELRAHPSAQNVRVAGIVQNDIVRSDGGLEVRFTESDGGQRLPVVYKGTLPDIFRPGMQVVVQGHLGSGGVFQASELQAKCPSRFATASPAE
jgi:cytochrome c-type biogenesis protein CcmE